MKQQLKTLKEIRDALKHIVLDHPSLPYLATHDLNTQRNRLSRLIDTLEKETPNVQEQRGTPGHAGRVQTKPLDLGERLERGLFPERGCYPEACPDSGLKLRYPSTLKPSDLYNFNPLDPQED